MTVEIIVGDCRTALAGLAAKSVHCCVTSPPYFGLRDYGVAGQMGLESTPDEFVAALVEVFREVRRVLRDDGTLWLNLGDSYSSGGRTTQVVDSVRGASSRNADNDAASGKQEYLNGTAMRPPVVAGLGSKQLLGMPWRTALALQADGWILRQDIIWSKPNPMPESVTDRCTKAHEYIFLLSKSPRYYYDAAAIMEPVAPSQVGRVRDDVIGGISHVERGQHSEGGRYSKSGNKERKPASARGVPVDTDGKSNGAVAGSIPWEGDRRNKRSVWSVGTMPFAEAHFATFPPDLIEPCILAGCPPGGVVLDPFGGAGTTGLVADRLQRNAVLVELNPAYADMARRRIHDDSPLFAGAAQ